MGKRLFVLLLSALVFSCQKQGTEVRPDPEAKEQVKEEVHGEHIFTINIPSGYITPGNSKFYVVLYDTNDLPIDYKVHTSGQEEQLKFYSEDGLGKDEKFSLSFIRNNDNTFFSIRIYKDLTLTSLGNSIQFIARGSGRIKTNLIDIPIIGKEDRWAIRASGGGNSIVEIDDKFRGSFSDYVEGESSEKLYIQYFNVDNLYDYKYNFISKEDLKNLSQLDVSTFVDDNVRRGSIAINLPYELAYLQIFGYENPEFFKTGLGHRICFNPARLDFHGIYYSYANIFPHLKYILQFQNYEIETIDEIPQEVPLPDSEIDYTFENGTIEYSGLPNFEIGRFYLRKQGADYSVRTILLADGESNRIRVPEIPKGLLGNDGLESRLQLNGYEFIQAAAEDYEEFNTYNDFIEETLSKGDLYYVLRRNESAYSNHLSVQIYFLFSIFQVYPLLCSLNLGRN